MQTFCMTMEFHFHDPTADESSHSEARGHDMEDRYGRNGHAGKRRLFVWSTRAVMQNDLSHTSEGRSHLPTSDGTDLDGEGPRIRLRSPVKEDLEQNAGKLAEVLTWTEMVGEDGVGVPVHLVQ